MKRELKFRAWNFPNKHMYYDIQKGVTAEKDGKLVLGISFDTICKDAGSEVMQFTGLKDKNGKEIYEGDIVEKNKTFAEVRYCSENAAFYTKARSFNFYFGWDISQKDLSVVGNIYENSDLLS